MAGFLENLLREGTSAGLGLIQGREAGQKQREQEAAARQREALELSLLQAQIDRTGRQDQPREPEQNPFSLIPDLDPALVGAAPGLSPTVQAGILERAGVLPGQPNQFDALENVPENIRRILKDLPAAVQTRVLEQYGHLEPEAKQPSLGQVRNDAKGVAGRYAEIAPKLDPEHIQAHKSVLANHLRENYPTLGDGEITGIVDSAFSSALRSNRPETGTILDLADLGEAWQNDPQAVAAIEQIEASPLPAEEKATRIAEVKRIAGGA